MEVKTWESTDVYQARIAQTCEHPTQIGFMSDNRRG